VPPLTTYKDIILKPDISISVYMHEKGGEIGIIFDYWYQTIVPLKIMKDDGMIEIIVRKKMYILEKNCNNTKEYNYLGKTNYNCPTGNN
jgi:hypothetical protein